jgi:AcrR family transcriptional regulator
MPKTSAAAKEARQEQILNAAVRCFARKGYYATTIEDLVVETGLSRGALYLYFPNKEALYVALSDRWTCGLEEAVQRRVTPNMSPVDALQLVIEVTGEHIEADAAACRVLMEGWTLGHVLPALGEQVRRQQAQARGVFE